MTWCTVLDCPRPHYGLDLCNMHYQRARKHGNATLGPRRAQIRSLPEIAALVKYRRIEDGHWLWTGTTNGVGYGVVFIRYCRWYVHRLSYVLAVGPIPPGMELDHLCRVRSCFNPEHLEAVTHAENMRRSPFVGRCRYRREEQLWR
jgi:hypothetical protein